VSQKNYLQSASKLSSLSVRNCSARCTFGVPFLKWKSLHNKNKSIRGKQGTLNPCFFTKDGPAHSEEELPRRVVKSLEQLLCLESTHKLKLNGQAHPTPSTQPRFERPVLVHHRIIPGLPVFREGNSRMVQRQQQIQWENPVRENITHYTADYACKEVLRSYLALGCERTYIAS
jgi:hypothetical protein